MKKILLDTNAYTHFLVGDEKVLDTLASTDVVFMSVFVLGELYAGFRGGKKERENKKLLDLFLLKPNVKLLEATRETAEVFGELKETLKKMGKPLPLNDVWIAAHALETGSVLVTYDDHFLNVPGLRLWDEIGH